MTSRQCSLHRPPVLAILAVALLVVGCTQEAGTLDRAATERAVKKVVGARITPPITTIRCPDDIPRGEDEPVVCRAILAGGSGEVRLRVTQTGAADQVNVALLDAVLDRDDVAEDLRQTLVETYLRTFEVDCGKPVITVLAPDETFACNAKDATETREITVTVTDPAGTLLYDIGG